MNQFFECTARQIVRATTSISFLFCIGCQSGLPVSDEFSGRVTKVHDGDSVHITPAGKKRIIVRLAAIDAPEIKQTHGIASRDFLRSLIMNREVAAHCNKLDKYQRHICVVTLNNTDINLEMLKAGHAWYYTQYKKEQNRRNQRAYSKAESQAKAGKVGLWKTSEALPPWKFRSLSRNN